jgi:hypothetical protein
MKPQILMGLFKSSKKYYTNQETLINGKVGMRLNNAIDAGKTTHFL